MMGPPQNGQRAINPATGETAVFQNGAWVKQVMPPAEAGMRGRLAIGMGPMVSAQQSMAQEEQQAGGNPLNRDWGAALASEVGFRGWHPLDPIAKAWGGQDYQNYTQAAKAFESQLMPIMSGAAVSPSEAQRQIRAALPELGDSAETLQRKAATRAQMLNGAARMMNEPLPYPNVNTYGINTSHPSQGQQQPSPQQQGGVPVYDLNGKRIR